jgi:WhiB family redox-sensing transcriptional regulator
MSLDLDADWREKAACRYFAEEMFVFGAAAQRHIAKEICGICVVRSKCLDYALDNRIKWGVWGGKTERQRKELLTSQSRPERYQRGEEAL